MHVHVCTVISVHYNTTCIIQCTCTYMYKYVVPHPGSVHVHVHVLHVYYIKAIHSVQCLVVGVCAGEGGEEGAQGQFAVFPEQCGPEGTAQSQPQPPQQTGHHGEEGVSQNSNPLQWREEEEKCVSGRRCPDA